MNLHGLRRAPDVAPVRSATTLKLAVEVLVRSCLNMALPRSRSACVKRETGRVGAGASATKPFFALQMVKTRSLASSSGSSAVRSCRVDRYGPALVDGQIEIAADTRRHVADLALGLPPASTASLP